ncbi:Hypothetical predicted protein [Olea europaea subsp. europaea]|uniref:Uncharacterized protein n=1 Tax=Olea europaea subsp. europaea TaxID=158383 RepID=A0A8S0TNC9_OLEEU|nr:Hypothetical predicted protein [Olea europaea subsp. europaea]
MQSWRLHSLLEPVVVVGGGAKVVYEKKWHALKQPPAPPLLLLPPLEARSAKRASTELRAAAAAQQMANEPCERREAYPFRQWARPVVVVLFVQAWRLCDCWHALTRSCLSWDIGLACARDREDKNGPTEERELRKG